MNIGFKKLKGTLDSVSEGIKGKIEHMGETNCQKIDVVIKTVELHPNNRNKENIKHVERKTKEIGKISKKELIKTREELEMMKNCRRSLIETLEKTHNKTASKNFRKSILKWNIPKIECIIKCQ